MYIFCQERKCGSRAAIITEKLSSIKQNSDGSHPWKSFRISTRPVVNKDKRHRRCTARHRAEDRFHNPAGYVRAESAPEIHAPTDPHPTLVLLDTAFV